MLNSDLFSSESGQLVAELLLFIFGFSQINVKLIYFPFILSFKTIDTNRCGSNRVKLILGIVDSLSKVSDSVFNFLFVVLRSSYLNLDLSLPFNHCIKIVLESWNLLLNCLDIDSSLLNDVQKVGDSFVSVILSLENSGSSDIFSCNFVVWEIGS